MNKKQILQVSLAGIIGFVIYVAVSILSGEVERWERNLSSFLSPMLYFSRLYVI